MRGDRAPLGHFALQVSPSAGPPALPSGRGLSDGWAGLAGSHAPALATWQGASPRPVEACLGDPAVGFHLGSRTATGAGMPSPRRAGHIRAERGREGCRDVGRSVPTWMPSLPGCRECPGFLGASPPPPGRFGSLAGEQQEVTGRLTARGWLPRGVGFIGRARTHLAWLPWGVSPAAARCKAGACP